MFLSWYLKIYVTCGEKYENQNPKSQTNPKFKEEIIK